MNRTSKAFALSCLLLAMLCFPIMAASEIRFVDVAATAGISGDTFSSPTSHSLGVNWVDVNNDGWDDLFLVGGRSSLPPQLFLNDGDGRFTRVSQLIPNLPAVEM